MNTIFNSENAPKAKTVLNVILILAVLSVLEEHFWLVIELINVFALLYLLIYALCWICMPLVALFKTEFADEIKQATDWFNSKFKDNNET